VGTYDNFDGPKQDYDFADITYTHDSGVYAKYGSFGKDFDGVFGDFIELGYGTTVSDIDLGISFIFNSDESSDQCDSSGTDISGECFSKSEGEALTFTIGKTFEL
jgi:hypothetical protein